LPDKTVKKYVEGFKTAALMIEFLSKLHGVTA
jgi:hypothetical protein